METVKIRFYREDPEAQIPEIPYNGSSGAFDIRATRTVTIPAHGRAEVPNGLRIMIPHGYYTKFAAKSGMYFKKNVQPYEGLIDFGYTGELACMMINNSDEDVIIEKGQKYCQMEVFKIPEYEVEEASFEEFEAYKNNPNNTRKDGGFGSSGI